MRFHHFGEEAYEETERAIQQLLGVDEELVRVDAGGLAEAADWDTLRSPETYVGHARGERRTDARADGLALNQWALAGDWTVGEESAVLDAAGGSIAYRFEGRDLNLVLAPPASGGAVRFAVRLDGRPPGDDHGLDVDEAGEGAVDEPRMYQLVRQHGPIRAADLRDHVPRPRRARLRLHLRLAEDLVEELERPAVARSSSAIVPSISTNSIRTGRSERLAQAWFVPRWTTASPGPTRVSDPSSSRSHVSPSSTTPTSTVSVRCIGDSAPGAISVKRTITPSAGGGVRTGRSVGSGSVAAIGAGVRR